MKPNRLVAALILALALPPIAEAQEATATNGHGGIVSIAAPFGTGTNAGSGIIEPETNRVGKNVPTPLDVFDIAGAQLRYQEDARTNHVVLDKSQYTTGPWSEIRLRASAIAGDGLAASLCSGSNALQQLSWLRLGATNGWTPSQVQLAKSLDESAVLNFEFRLTNGQVITVQATIDVTETELAQAMSKDSPGAVFLGLVGSSRKRNEVSKDANEAKFWRSKAQAGLPRLKADAARNYARALYALGLLHQSGDLVESNAVFAAEMIHKAAESGLAPAQESWGSYCAWRLTNEVEAVGWYYRAATQGLVRAQSSLSRLHSERPPWEDFDPRFQPKARERARWAFERASQPIACFTTYEACNELGELYFNGLGVQSNAVEAVKWFRRAIGLGISSDGTAEYNLALCYFGGDGVAQDDAEGLQWIQKATANGYRGSRALEESLTAR